MKCPITQLKRLMTRLFNRLHQTKEEEIPIYGPNPGDVIGTPFENKKKRKPSDKDVLKHE